MSAPGAIADHAFSDIRHECFPFSGIKATANGGYSCRHGHADHAFFDIRHECFPFSGIKATANGGYSCRYGHADQAFSDIRHECFPFSAIKATPNGGFCFVFSLLCILRIIRGSCPAITRKDYGKVSRFGSARPKGQP